LLAALCCTSLAAGCTRTLEPIGLEIRRTTHFEVDWHRYGKVRTSKAFAFAGDPTGLSVTGMAYGMPSRLEAEARALDYCEEQRVARGLAVPCVIYAVDDDLLDVSAGAPSDASIRPGS